MCPLAAAMNSWMMPSTSDGTVRDLCPHLRSGMCHFEFSHPAKTKRASKTETGSSAVWWCAGYGRHSLLLAAPFRGVSVSEKYCGSAESRKSCHYKQSALLLHCNSCIPRSNSCMSEWLKWQG